VTHLTLLTYARHSQAIVTQDKELSAPELERRRREPRVLHFLGHGEMDGLWFEREDGSGELVRANRIVRLLKGSPVKLALLNACWSATDLVASLCDRLKNDGGISAAIGHGNPMADASAIEFAREFYRHVLLGKTSTRAQRTGAGWRGSAPCSAGDFRGTTA